MALENTNIPCVILHLNDSRNRARLTEQSSTISLSKSSKCCI